MQTAVQRASNCTILIRVLVWYVERHIESLPSSAHFVKDAMTTVPASNRITSAELDLKVAVSAQVRCLGRVKRSRVGCRGERSLVESGSAFGNIRLARHDQSQMLPIEGDCIFEYGVLVVER